MSLDASTKTLLDVQTYVKRQFGDESGVQITDADILRWVNSAQVEVASITKCIKARSQADITAGTFQYTLPLDATLQIEALRVDDIPVPGREFGQAEQDILTYDPKRTLTGPAQYWYRWADVIYFWPTPDKTIASGITLFYAKMPVPLVNPGDLLGLPDRYFKAIVQYVMAEAFELDEDYQAASGAREQFNLRLTDQFEEERTTEALYYPKITTVDWE